MKRALIFAFLFFLLYFFVLIWHDIRKIREIKITKKKLEFSLNSQKKESETLIKKITDLNNSYNIEVLAKRKLGLIRKGETGFKVIN